MLSLTPVDIYVCVALAFALVIVPKYDTAGEKAYFKRNKTRSWWRRLLSNMAFVAAGTLLFPIIAYHTLIDGEQEIEERMYRAYLDYLDD